ncbi:MAG: efflux RND transporter permease subunit [Nitrospirota bacterium]|nr:efflux RND transporter permease subunit [Nitrospirota bacterium]
MRLILLFVNNPVFVNLLLVLTLASGGYFYATMTREVFPEIPLDLVAIQTTYPGISPEQIERDVTIPIEDAVHAISGVDEISSRSLEGVSMLELKLEQGANMAKVAQDARSEIDRLVDLPENAEDPVVIEIESQFPVINVTVHGDVREDALRRVAKNLETAIDDIRGVSSVTMTGYRDREVAIELDPMRMAAFGVGTEEVTGAVTARNRNLPAGLIRGQRSEFLVRTEGQYADPADLGGVVVRRRPDGHHVRLRDIGTVRVAFEDEESFGKLNGERAISLEVTKDRRGDTIAIVDEVTSIIATARADAPPGLSITTTRDGSVWIKSRLRTLYTNGGIGFVLVCAILFALLDWRMAFWVAAGIPTAFLLAFVLMHMAGMSVNMLSLFALIVVLGLIVDDAIIITENVYRYLLKGVPPRVAAVVGAVEVMTPVLAATTTTIAAFLPMLLMSGIMGKFMRVIPIVVTFCLVATLFESLVMLPSHLAETARGLGRNIRRESRHFARLRQRYTHLIVVALRHRYLTVGGLMAVAVLSVVVMIFQMKFVMFNTKDLPGFAVMLETPEGSSLTETERVLAEVEAVGRQLPPTDLNAMVSLVGNQFDISTGRSVSGSHLGMIYFELADFDAPDRRNGYLVLDDFRTRLTGITGYESLRVVETQGGPPVGRAVEVKVRGENMDTLRAIARQVEGYLKDVPGIYDVVNDDVLGKPELTVTVDEDRAALYGLSATTIARAVRIAFEGETVSEIRQGNDSLDVVVRYAGKFSDRPQRLGEVRIHSASAGWVPLSSVTRMELTQGASAVIRKNRMRTILVSSAVNKEVITSTEANALVKEHFADISRKYPGYNLLYGGENEEQIESLRSLGRAAALAMMLIYLILGTLFRSLLQPVVIMSVIPFSFIGVVVGHLVMGQPLGMLSLIGLAGLVGVVVNDSLVLVSFVNNARRGGAPRWNSLVRSARNRLRPILLTSVTTIAGMASLSFQTRGQAAYLAPMAISIVWGLAFATVLTLVMVPCVLAILDDMGRRLGFRMGQVPEVEPLLAQVERAQRELRPGSGMDAV